MIFVTVGTHEQGFTRLIKKIDELVKDNLIKDKVFIQSGYTKYVPKFCEYKEFLTYEEMEKFYLEADIIITHGGPASFMEVIKNNKVPIVVPRLKKYDEHINDHQLIFTKEVNSRLGGIILVEDIDDLEKIINNYSKYSKEVMSFKYNNANFCNELNLIVEGLINGEKND